jgi:hypothetical protein
MVQEGKITANAIKMGEAWKQLNNDIKYNK